MKNDLRSQKLVKLGLACPGTLCPTFRCLAPEPWLALALCAQPSNVWHRNPGFKFLFFEKRGH